MKETDGMKRFLVLSLLFLIILAVATAAVWPEASGKKKKSNGDLTIDYSHEADGYVIAKSKKGKKKLKLRVKCSGETLDYDLDKNGSEMVIPLQFGSGKYTFSLYKNVSGKKYSEAGKISLSLSLDNEMNAFLCPNTYVNYSEKSAAVKEALKMCKGMTSQSEIYKTITAYIKKNYQYDYIKMVQVKSGQMPDIDDCFKRHMGICQDLAALTCCMLRVNGVPARFMIGTVNGNLYHAWTTVYVDGEERFFDPTAEVGGISKDSSYTLERYY